MSPSDPTVNHSVSTPASYHPDFTADGLHRGLAHLVLPDTLSDPVVTRWVTRLERRFKVYMSVYPYGLWAPGLAVEQEMRTLTDLLLPLQEIRTAVSALCRASLVPRLPQTPLFHSAKSWLDILSRLPASLCIVDPARLLETLLVDPHLRNRFLFAVHLPDRHGGGFRRYPRQLEYLKNWLSARRIGGAVPLACLDAACGSGEGTYELAMLLAEAGFEADEFVLHGVSIDPLEIFAAAHAYFPNDKERQNAFRAEIAPVSDAGGEKSITFIAGDLTDPRALTDLYDLILCNGILGGPLLHHEEQLRVVAKSLADRLKPGGLLVAADRFHAGWGKKRPKEVLLQFFVSCGLAVDAIDEGIAVIKKAAA